MVGWWGRKWLLVLDREVSAECWQHVYMRSVCGRVCAVAGGAVGRFVSFEPAQCCWESCVLQQQCVSTSDRWQQCCTVSCLPHQAARAVRDQLLTEHSAQLPAGNHNDFTHCPRWPRWPRSDYHDRIRCDPVGGLTSAAVWPFC